MSDLHLDLPAKALIAHQRILNLGLVNKMITAASARVVLGGLIPDEEMSLIQPKAPIAGEAEAILKAAGYLDE